MVINGLIICGYLSAESLFKLITFAKHNNFNSIK